MLRFVGYIPQFFLGAVLLGWLGQLSACAELPEQIDFNFHIRPILSDRCYACHGPDEENRAADLRLDTPEGAYGESYSGERTHVIKPGDISASELLRRVTSDDEDIVMPPPESHLTVTQEEVALLKKWIEQGAKWKEHWSFLPIENPKPPEVKNKEWLKNAIDHFVLSRLENEGLQPSPEASRERLARRLYFDLTGLPPTVEQLDAFLADDSPEAYERLVDELLASPHFGERMAVDWLDLARYADTYGYQEDSYRPVWPYRDWVVREFNENMPHDQFVTEQLAGDLLPNATQDQILATAFNRVHRQTSEGGSVEEEFRIEYVVDRTDTFGLAFLGLSLGCARCHDHKFDPLSQKEYYQVSAFFDNIDERGLYAYFAPSTPTPTLMLSTDDQQAEMAKLAQEIKASEERLETLAAEQQPAFEKWLDQLGETPEIPGEIGRYEFDTVGDDQTPNSLTAKDEKPTFGKLYEEPQLIDGRRGKAFKLSGENVVMTPEGGNFSRHDPFTISLWVKVPKQYDRAVVFHRTRASIDAGHRGYELTIIDGKLNAWMAHFWPGDAMAVAAKEKLPVGRWVQVGIAYDGSSKAAGLKVIMDGKIVATETLRDGLTQSILYKDGIPERNAVDTINDATKLSVGRRFRDRGLINGEVDDLQIFNRQLSKLEIATLHDGKAIRNRLAQRSKANIEELRELYLLGYSETYSSALKQLEELRYQRGNLLDRMAEISVMKELPMPRQSYVLERGAYDAKGEPVDPGVLQKVLPWDESFPRNRLGLAAWLTHKDNPLFARVAVNRLWQGVFGRGLVATQEDFGTQGELPTHPDLLDYLATEFRDSGWNVKAIIKQMVMSATYRQSSDCDPQERENDPTNALLARGSSNRLPAEMIRDNALKASGLLVEKIGGPPVKPYQPPGLWKEKGPKVFKRDPGEGSRRRSLYTFWKRTSPPPAMVTLDAALRANCIVRRQATATPLQALVLLNDPQYVEASRALATKAIKELPNSSDAERIEFVFRALTSRRPHAKEIDVLLRLLTDQRQYFQTNRVEVDKFLSVGDEEVDTEIEPTELAAYTVLAKAIMNLDECVVKR
ncbi:MAG: DUF1553 domain-containing protein [Lacipirellulaceae bacterium]